MLKMASNLVSIRRRPEKGPQNARSGTRTESRVYNSILELVGNTPLIKLNRVPKDHGVQCEIYAKCEFLNPSGSIKDRVALAMIQDARKNGIVHDYTEFVEPSSGNTGIGVAFNAILSGNKCTIVTEDKNSSEKVNTIKLLGSQVIQTKYKETEFKIARQLKDDNPDQVVMLNQFDNPVNPKTHYENTAEEILSALGNVDVLVLGAGTGGTLSGVGKKLKEKNPKCLVAVGDPEGSTMFNKEGKRHPFLVEGIGGYEDIPIVCDQSMADHFEVVTDQEAFLMSRELARKEGLLCGGSSGLAMAAAIKAVKTLNICASKRVVVILPDGIRNYMTKFVSDQWMEAYRFMEPPEHSMKWWNKSISEINYTRSYPKLNKESTCEQALEAMKCNDVNIAVIVNEDGYFLGAVSKDNLRNRATNPTKLPGQVSEIFDFEDLAYNNLDKDVYTLAENVGTTPTIGLLSRILDITPYVILGREEKGVTSNEDDIFIPSGVVTADDVLDYIHDHS